MTEQEIRALVGSTVTDPAVRDALIILIDELGKRSAQLERSLRLLESAIKHDYDSIVITELTLDEPGPRIVYVNDGFTRMTGYSREEVIGKTPRILQGPKTDRAVLDRLKDMLKKGQSFFGQTVNYRKDGSEFINQWDIHPLTNADGDITHWVSYQHDITDRKRSELSLIDPEIETDDLFEHSKSTYVDISLDGSLAGANKAFRDLTGYTKEELLRMKFWQLMPEKHGNALKDQFQEMINSGSHTTYKLLMRNKNSQLVQVQIQVKKMRALNQEILRGTVHNLTLRKHVLHTLKKRNNGFSNIFDRKVDYNSALILDEQGNPHFKWVSDSFSIVTGFGAEECLNEEGLKKIVHPEDYAVLMDHLRTAFEGKSSCTNYRIKTKDGHVKKMLDYAKPDQTEPDGVVSSVRTSTIDISGREQQTAV